MSNNKHPQTKAERPGEATSHFHCGQCVHWFRIDRMQGECRGTVPQILLAPSQRITVPGQAHMQFLTIFPHLPADHPICGVFDIRTNESPATDEAP